MAMFFRQYLEEDVPVGPDVALLQMFLLGRRYYEGLVDGDYGPVTAQAVQLLQQEMRENGHDEVDADGKFGPISQTAFKKMTGVDLGMLDGSLLQLFTRRVS